MTLKFIGYDLGSKDLGPLSRNNYVISTLQYHLIKFLQRISVLMSYRTLFTLIGAILAQGAPVGYIIYCFWTRENSNVGIVEFLRGIYLTQFFVIAYMWCGTTFFFSGFGFMVGLMAQHLFHMTEMKNRFIGIVSHDLRNPISNLMNFSEVLLETDEITAEAKRDILKRMHNTSTFMLSLTNDLLDFTKIESGTLAMTVSVVNFNQLIEDVVQDISPLANRKNIKILCVKSEKTCWLEIDQHRIEQVLINLLTNAIKFSPVGSVIEMSFGMDTNGFNFNIEDHGQGIAQTEVGRLFKPFSTTSTLATQREKCTGLGLYIVKKIIDLHGGKIDVTSELGKGTIIRFSIPVVQAEPAFSEVIGFPPVQGQKILIVDDSEDMIMLCKRFVADMAYKFDFAFDGKVAFQMIQDAVSGGCPYSLVLMDLEMPVQSGLETALILKKEGHTSNDFEMIAMTASTDGDKIDSAYKAGFDRYLQKPVSKDLLRRTITEALGRKFKVKKAA